MKFEIDDYGKPAGYKLTKEDVQLGQVQYQVQYQDRYHIGSDLISIRSLFGE